MKQKLIDMWLPILIVACIARNQLGIPVLEILVGYSYYIALLLLIVFNVKHAKSIYIVPILFLAACFISIVLGNPLPIFNSYNRLFLLLALVMACSPALNSQKAAELRTKIFICFMWYFTAVSLISFCCYFLGINYSTRALLRGEAMLEHAGYFGGITAHSMFLGPIAAVATLFTFKMFLETQKKAFAFCCGISILTILLSASRASLIAACGGIIYMLFFFPSHVFSSSKKYIITICAIICLLPFISNFSHLVEAKTQANLNSGGFTSSRASLWVARWQEFLDSPIWGCGYASERITREISLTTGRIEPGTSWGAIFAQTGLLGGVLFSWIFFKGLIKQHNISSPDSVLIASVLIFYALHMCAEGYGIAAGNPNCFFLWLTMSVALMSNQSR